MSENETDATIMLNLPTAKPSANIMRVSFSGAPPDDGAVRLNLTNTNETGQNINSPSVSVDFPGGLPVNNATQQSFPSETSTSMMGLPNRPLPDKAPATNFFRDVSSKSFPMYKCYPAMETMFQRSLGNFPESNKEAVMAALRNLQEKIGNLEREKNDALSNLSNLSAETGAKHVTFSSQSDGKTPCSEATISEISDLTLKLSNAETRCMSLNKYLNDLKHSFEEYFGLNFEDTINFGGTPLIRDRQYQTPNTACSTLNTEKDRLLCVKEQTEKKIKDLEARLQQERRYKRMIEEKSFELDETFATYQSLPGKYAKHSTPISQSERRKKREYPTSGNTSLDQSLLESNSDMSCLLSQLEEEFEHLKSHCNDMQQMMISTSSSDLQASIYKELDDIRLKMQLKLDQINKVSKIIKQMEYLNGQREDSSNTRCTWSSCHACSKSAGFPVCEDDRRVQVLTTITACGRATLQTSCLHCGKTDTS